MLKSQCISCCLRVALQHYSFIWPMAPLRLLTLMVGVFHCILVVFVINTVTFNDDHSRFTGIYFLHYKSQVFLTFKKFHHLVETQFNSKIKILRWDSRREYYQEKCHLFCLTRKLIIKKSCPYTPWQNGIAERKTSTYS